MNRFHPTARFIVLALVAFSLLLGAAIAPALAWPLPLIADDSGLSPNQQPSPQPPAQPQRPAQPQGMDKPRTERRERGGAPVAHVPELRDETFRLVDAYFISNLQESLGLSNEQFAKILPLVNKVQSDRRNLAKRRMHALRQLRKTLAAGSATEASVSDLLRDLKSASADERAETLRNIELLDAELTPLQQAKYRVFEAEVDLRLRHLLARSQDRGRSEKR